MPKPKSRRPKPYFWAVAEIGLATASCRRVMRSKDSRPALVVDDDQSNQREHRADGQVDRQLHRRIAAIASTPDADHDEGRDQREFVEEVEKEDVHAGEDAHQPGLHDQQQREVDLEPFRPGLDRVESRRQPHHTRHDKERQGNAVQAELEPDAEQFEAEIVGRQEHVGVTRIRGKLAPEPQGNGRGHAETEVGELDGVPLGQAGEDRQGHRERGRDRDE
jgi:hypothetical protein